MENTLILLYHNIVHFKKMLDLYDVNFQKFKSHMELLRLLPSLSVMTLDTSRYTEKTRDTRYAQRNTNVVLTFDDGYCSWPRAVLNLLKNFNFRAHFFICIKNLKEGEITKKDIIKLKNNGMVIGSHSMTHCFLNTLSKKDVFYELNESKKILEDIIQDEVKYFSIPRGIYTKEVIEIAKRAGYKNLFTSEIGINYNQDFLLKRIPIKRNTKLSDFKDILNGKNVERMAFNQKLKDKAKVLLGIDNYNRLRKALVPRVE